MIVPPLEVARIVGLLREFEEAPIVFHTCIRTHLPGGMIPADAPPSLDGRGSPGIEEGEP